MKTHNVITWNARHQENVLVDWQKRGQVLAFLAKAQDALARGATIETREYVPATELTEDGD